MSSPSSLDRLNRLAEEFWGTALVELGAVPEVQARSLVRSLLLLRWLNERFSVARLSLAHAARTPGTTFFREDPRDREVLLEQRQPYVAAGVPWISPLARWGHVYTWAHRHAPKVVIVQALQGIEHEPTRTDLQAQSASWQYRAPPPKRLRQWLTQVDRLALAEPLPTLLVLEHLLGLPTPSPLEEGRSTGASELDARDRRAKLISRLDAQVREFAALQPRIRQQLGDQ